MTRWTCNVLSACLALGCAHLAQAQGDNVWILDGSGLWSNPLNWSQGFTPGTDFPHTLINNANTKTVTLDASIQNQDLVINQLTVSAPPGFTNTLLLSNVGIDRPLSLRYILTVAGGGHIVITNSALRLEGAPPGDLVVSNGAITLDDGLLETVGTIMRVGRGARGELLVNRGTVLVGTNLQVGVSTNGFGVFQLHGGTVNVQRKFDVADDNHSTGIVVVTGGTLLATNPLINATIGDQGLGMLTISNGLVRLSDVDIGRATNSQGAVTLAGGTLEVLGRLTIGDDRGSAGAIVVLGGELIATNRLLGARIGDDGVGSLTVSNGLVRLGDASVGRDNTNGHGTLILAGGTIRCDDITVGRDGASGQVLVTGGEFLLGGDVFRIGRDSFGEMTIAGGLVRARGMRIGISNDAMGALTLTGGTTLLSSNLVVGNLTLTTNNPTGFTNATGTVLMNGGVLAITNASGFATLEMRYGTATINAGELILDQLLLTNTAGTLVFNGGTLSTIDILANNGLPFVVGGGVSPATLELRGGTARVPNGLIIASNARVIGCGRILGEVTVQPGGQNALVRCPPGPPTVVLSAPRPGERFLAPATVTLVAPAGDPDGDVVKVEFFEGATLLHEDATEPHSFDWQDVPPGTYAFTARATDDAGNMTTSGTISITVTNTMPPPVTDLHVVEVFDNINNKRFFTGSPEGDAPVVDLNTILEEGQVVIGSGPAFWWEIQFADPEADAPDPTHVDVTLQYRAETDWVGMLMAEYRSGPGSLASVVLPVSSNALNTFTWDLSSVATTRAIVAASRLRIINASANGKKISPFSYARMSYGTAMTNPPVVIPPIVITNTARAAGQLRFSFSSTNSITYRVECTTSPAVNPWQWLTNITATGPLTRFTNSATSPQLFYRVRSQ